MRIVTRRSAPPGRHPEEKAEALRHKIRWAEMTRDSVEESLDGNYEDFVKSWAILERVEKERLRIPFANEKSGKDKEEDYSDGSEIAEEISGLNQEKQALTEKLAALVRGNESFREQISQRRLAAARNDQALVAGGE
jgi:DNA repair exonuclease SbcCD ATPase subunit